MKGIIGAIAGDVIGSAYEFNPTRDHDFELFTPKSSFTDDTVLTMANALWLIDDEQHTHERLVEIMLDLCRRYPNRGYGGRFANWICDKDPQPYNSYGNGSAMRVSPVGYYAQSLEEALALAKVSAEVTHNHPEGITGAQATAAAIFLARCGKSKQEIRDYVAQTFDYDLSRTLDEIRPTFTFDETCQRTVPEAITCFMEG
jgi:ADP-ribosylglycohydrolase